ncbi:MAG: hybrid sensor histidine kinase/response regulator [Dissulfurispiraceae bacterium]|jgi:signal transduction histidine kinase|nr:hybrid sensor histidine kinase/response regulator [Dissulfurispiraceae bacterium]
MTVLQRGTVMVVDDEPLTLEATALILEAFGFNVLQCSRPQDVIPKLRQEQVDAVLSDIRMPAISGLELMDQIRQLDSNIPVILMTAYADMDVAIEALKKGAFDFIIKPYNHELLATAVYKALNYRRLLKMEQDYTLMLEAFNKEIETLISERTMGLMALTVADKLRNPASVIGLKCRRIIEKSEAPPNLLQEVQDIFDESEKLNSIVKDFESILKTRCSMFSYEDINPVMLSIIPVVEKEAGIKGVSLAVSLSKEPLRINAQTGLLRVAFFQLLRNAVEATPAGGSVTITTSAHRDYIKVSVSDTGEGIPEQDTALIFDPFYSTKSGSFGMGLSLVKQIVNEHMGSISVENQPGVGAVFIMKFPVKWLASAPCCPDND